MSAHDSRATAAEGHPAPFPEWDGTEKRSGMERRVLDDRRRVINAWTHAVTIERRTMAQRRSGIDRRH